MGAAEWPPTPGVKAVERGFGIGNGSAGCSCELYMTHVLSITENERAQVATSYSAHIALRNHTYPYVTRS